MTNSIDLIALKDRKEYVLMCKHNGEYKIHTETNTVKEMAEQLTNLVETVEKKYKKNSN